MSYYDDYYSNENEQDYDQPAQYDPENAWLYEQNDYQNTRVSEKMSCIQYKTIHTSYDSSYKWTKISSLEIDIFWLKNDGEKWSRIFLF